MPFGLVGFSDDGGGYLKIGVSWIETVVSLTGSWTASVAARYSIAIGSRMTNGGWRNYGRIRHHPSVKTNG